MKKIKLTQNKYALVDNSDFGKVSEFKWRFGKNGYALRHEYYGGEKGKIHATRKVKTIYLHNFVFGENENVIDHINQNKLDCRKDNLRSCSHSQNQANQGLQKNNTSGYKGVIKTPFNTWAARIKYKQKKIHLGTFKCKEEAARAYNSKAKELFGEFAYLNKV
jgi:hypothetical protein